MIKSDKGRVEIKETKSGIAADLACIVKSMMETDIGFTKEEILEIVELASKDDDDLAKEAADVLVDAVRTLVSKLLEARDTVKEKESSDAEG